jgi:hypothetical protein
LRNVMASIGTAGPPLSGSITIPRGCAHPENCIAQFDLRAGELNTAALSQLFSTHNQPWYRTLFGEAATAPFLMRTRAVGQITVAKLMAGAIAATNVQSEVRIDRGVFRFDDVSAQVFGGRHAGSWIADFTGAQPKYSGRGELKRLSAVELGESKDSCSGTVNLAYSISLTGRTRAEMLKSSVAEGDFVWSNGAFNRFSLPLAAGGKPPAASGLRFSEFRGHAKLQAGSVELTRGKIVGPNGIYQVSGTVGLDQRISLTLASRLQKYSLGGTLDVPEIATEARRTTVSQPAGPASSPVVAKAGPGAN